MSNKKSAWALGSQPMPSPNGSETVNVLLKLEADVGNLTLGDLLIMGYLPEDCVLVDAVFAADDLDSGAGAVALDFGVVNAGETDLAATLESGLSIAVSGGAARWTPTLAGLETQAGSAEGGAQVAFKVATAPSTAQAGTVAVSLTYRQTAHGA